MAIARIDTSALVDQSSFGKSQVWIFLLCFMAMVVDGYDLQIIGVAAAGIREALSLEPTVLGLVITAGQVGVILGALVLAPFADRVGRKWLIIGSCVIFGAFSFLTAFATNAAPAFFSVSATTEARA